MYVWQRRCPMCQSVLIRPADRHAWWCRCGWTTEDVSRGVLRREAPDNQETDDVGGDR
jgi:hypothetical protein